MTGFFSKLFGKGKKEEGSFVETLKDALEGLIERGGFKLYYDVKESSAEKVVVELHGEDEAMLKEKEGQLLDAFQFYLKRVLQHQYPELKADLIIDTNGFREESAQALIELAEKLKTIVIEKNRSVYFRALPPKDRKVIHQYLADDSRVKSRSIGDGHFKKIKIFPTGSNGKGPGKDLDSKEETLENQEPIES